MNIIVPDLSQLRRIPYALRKQLPSISAVYFLIGAGEVIQKPAGGVA
jgi:hypothetical protein